GGHHHVVVPEDDRVGPLHPLGELLQGRALRGEPCQGVLDDLVVYLAVPEGLPELHGGGGVDVLVPHRDGDGGLGHLLSESADQFLFLVALHVVFHLLSCADSVPEFWNPWPSSVSAGIALRDRTPPAVCDQVLR